MAGEGEGRNVEEGLQYLDFILEVIGSQWRCKSRRKTLAAMWRVDWVRSKAG